MQRTSHKSGPFVTEVRLNRGNVPSFEVYPFNLPVVREFSSLKLHPRVTILVGEYASGKSTLLEAIAVAWGFNAEGGSRNFNFSTQRSHSDLHEYLTLVKTGVRPRDGYFLRAESFFNVISEIERLDDEPEGGPPLMAAHSDRSLHQQSHGESFLALFCNRFRGGF